MNDIGKGLQALFKAKPALLDDVRVMIENVNVYLYARDINMYDTCAFVFGDCLDRVCNAAREIPALQEWVGELEEFERREPAALMASLSEPLPPGIH